MRFLLLKTLLIGLVLSLFAIHPAIGKEFHLISSADGSQQPSAGGGSDSYSPIMTPNGDHILFTSAAGNLCLTTNQTAFLSSYAGGLNVFVRNRTNGTTTLLSVNTNGTGFGNADSIGLGISTNGQIALFESAASNLVANDTNKTKDVFIRNLVDETTVRVSVSTNGGNANGVSRDAVMTPDGRYVAFVSAATNLVVNDTNGIADVFVRDLESGTTVLASSGATRVNLESISEAPLISNDGRFVAFRSTATNLVPGVSFPGQVYLRDLQAGLTVFASAEAVVQSTNNVSYNHTISADGRHVVFQTGGAQAIQTILRYDRQTGATETISTNAARGTLDGHTISMTPDGRFVAFISNTNPPSINNTSVRVWDANSGETTLVSGTPLGAIPPSSTCEWPSIDPSGRFVSFVSNASGLVTNALSGAYHVYVRDLLSGSTTLINVNTNGTGSPVGPMTVPQMSDDGQFVAFDAFDGGIVSGDDNRTSDVFLRDTVNNTTELVSARAAELPSFAGAGSSTISSSAVSWTGRYIAFVSTAENLVTNDGNSKRDIFVRDNLEGSTSLVSVNTNGVSANGTSTEPSISGDGRYVAFTSSASDLAAKGTNKVWNVFVRDLYSQTIVLGSVATNAIAGANSDSSSPQLSADGRFLLFFSKASNLVTTATGTTNLFLRDLAGLTTVALTTHGVVESSITRDGRYIAFLGNVGSGNRLFIWDSLASARVYTNHSLQIASGVISPNGQYLAYVENSQLYILNWRTGSALPAGATTLPLAGGLQFSGDERFLTFSTKSPGPSDGNSTFDTFLFDLGKGIKTQISTRPNATAAADAASIDPAISYDGRFVAYRSFASNLVLHATNSWPKIVLYDRIKGTNTLVNFGANQFSLAPVFSGNGRFLVFPTSSSAVNAEDQNSATDLFGYAFLYATVTPGISGDGPTISWPTMPGENYQVQFKENVDDPSWQVLDGDILISETEASIKDSSPTGDQRIYRILAF